MVIVFFDHMVLLSMPLVE